jgi:Bacterial Ig-like domain
MLVLLLATGVGITLTATPSYGMRTFASMASMARTAGTGGMASTGAVAGTGGMAGTVARTAGVPPDTTPPPPPDNPPPPPPPPDNPPPCHPGCPCDPHCPPPCNHCPCDPHCPPPCNHCPCDPQCKPRPCRCDNTRPRVEDVFPNDGARGVSVSTDVIATFSEDVRGVDEDTFVLFRSSSGTEVRATVFRRNDSDQWTLRPDDRLQAGTRYTAELEGGDFAIEDFAGNALFDFDWSFTTAGNGRTSDFRRPRVVDEFPRAGATGVSRFADVRVHFSEAVRGVSSRTFGLFDTRTRDFVAADVFRQGSSRRWVLEPGSRLGRSTRYTVVVRGGSGGIRDLAGNHLSTTTWSFRTSG